MLGVTTFGAAQLPDPDDDQKAQQTAQQAADCQHDPPVREIVP